MESNRLIGQKIGSWIARRLSAVGLGGRKNADTSEATLVVTLPDGRKLTTADLRGLTGRMNVRDGKLLEVQGTVCYEIIGAGNVPPGAKALHEKGRLAGGRAEYAKAIEFFEAASRMAPEWPYPVYDRAVTHLLMGEAESGERFPEAGGVAIAARTDRADGRYCADGGVSGFSGFEIFDRGNAASDGWDFLKVG